MPSYDVIVVGTICCDVIFHGLPSFPKLGEEIWTDGVEVTAGGAMNSPAALSRLGLDVGITTPLGNDMWGNIILSKVKEEGIHTDLIYDVNGPCPQVSVALNYDNDRSFVSYSEPVNQSKYINHIRNIVADQDANCFHFYSSPEEGLTDVMQEVKQKGKLLSLDTGWDPEWLKSEDIWEQIALADVFLPNLKEAQLITGKLDKYEALEELAKFVPTVVIKLGEEGAICCSNGEIVAYEAEKLECKDATGAGDCFIAGFLYGWLNNKDIEMCLKLGNYCGGSCVSVIGGYAGAPYEQEILPLLSKSNV